MAASAIARDGSLVRAIGVAGLTAGIVNVTIGGGIFRLPADVARALGPAAPIAYVATAMTMGLIVLCFAEAGSRVDLTGGPYAYVETALGPLAGFLAGVLLWVVGTLVSSAVAVVLAANTAQAVPALSTRPGAAALLAAVFGVLVAVNVRGVRQGTRLITLATVAKLLPLLGLVVVGPFFVERAHLVWSTPPAAAVARTSALLVFAFGGIECALVPSGEVRDVARTIPRAVFLAMATVTLLYIALQVVAQGVLGPELATSEAPLAAVGGRLFGPAGRMVVLVGAGISMFGNVSGMILAIPRILFAFARDGFLPAPLAAVHLRYRTPHVAIVVQSLLVYLLAVTSTFERLAILATSATLLLYAGCCVSAAVLRHRDVRAAGALPFRLRGGALAPWAACLAIAWILTGVTRAEWGALALTLALATGVFFVTARARAARSGYAG